MNREAALDIIYPQLTQKRYDHTLRVTDTALELAKIYGADLDKTETAGLYHDYAKYHSEADMAEIIRTQPDIPDDLLAYNLELWHSHVGAYLLQDVAGLQDTDVLQAIRYHTTGRAGMSLLEKIIFIADYIEPGRSFPGVEAVRRQAYEDLDGAIVASLQNTVQFLMSQTQKVYPDTFAAYNDLV